MSGLVSMQYGCAPLRRAATTRRPRSTARCCGDDWLVQSERGLQLLHRALAVDELLENPDTRRVRHDAEELALENENLSRYIY